MDAFSTPMYINATTIEGFSAPSLFNNCPPKFPQPCYVPPPPPKPQCFVPQKPACYAKPVVTQPCNSTGGACDVSKPLWILGAIVIAALLLWLFGWLINNASKRTAAAAVIQCPFIPAATTTTTTTTGTTTTPVMTPASPAGNATVAAANGAAAALGVTNGGVANGMGTGAANGNANGAGANAAVNGNGTLTPQNAQPINKPTLDSLKNGGNVFIVMFYSDSCSYCKTAFPQYDQAARGSAVPMYVMHSRDVTRAESSTMRGYPTIRAYNANGTTEDHNGSRDANSLRQFAQSVAAKNPAQAQRFQVGQQQHPQFQQQQAPAAAATTSVGNGVNGGAVKNAINWQQQGIAHQSAFA